MLSSVLSATLTVSIEGLRALGCNFKEDKNGVASSTVLYLLTVLHISP